MTIVGGKGAAAALDRERMRAKGEALRTRETREGPGGLRKQKRFGGGAKEIDDDDDVTGFAKRGRKAFRQLLPLENP